MKRALPLLLAALLGLFLVAGVGFQGGVEPPGRAFLLERGRQDTGAVNLVTSIYLGYRAFDTLGETIVLMMAVAAVTWYLERRH